MSRFSESDANGDFVCAELFRRVKLGVRQVDVADSEATYRFHREADNRITGNKRRAIYLQPQVRNGGVCGNSVSRALPYCVACCATFDRGFSRCILGKHERPS